MSGTDSKPRFGGNTNKSRFGGGTAIKYGGGFKKNQTTDKGPTPGLEEVFFVIHKSNAKMMTQFRKGTDALATYVGKEFGGVAGPMAAQAIRTRTEPVEDEPEAPEGIEAAPGSLGMIKWKV
jgi:hypothetical protein